MPNAPCKQRALNHLEAQVTSRSRPAVRSANHTVSLPLGQKASPKISIKAVNSAEADPETFRNMPKRGKANGT